MNHKNVAALRSSRRFFTLALIRTKVLSKLCLESSKKKQVITPPSYLEQLGANGNDSRDHRGWSVTVTYFVLVNVEEVHFDNDSCSNQRGAEQL